MFKAPKIPMEREALHTNGATAVHLVAIPYPGRGHINPMLTLCHLLSARLRHTLLVTVVVTEEWLSILSSSDAPPPANLRLRAIPNVLPSERTRGLDFNGFIRAVTTEMPAPVERLVEALETPADAIITDPLMPWVSTMGRRMAVPVSSLFPQSASGLQAVCRFAELDASRSPEEPIDAGDEENGCLKYLHRLSPTHCTNFSLDPTTSMLWRNFIQRISWQNTAQSIVFTSIYELESHAIDVLRSKLTPPIYSVGAAIPSIKLEDNDSANVAVRDHYRWLDSQPRSSVLYVSLGSYLSVSDTQMSEMAKGIRDAGVQCFWVVRGDQLDNVDKDLGLFVPWCEQLKVLCHPSVGGFLTHCGWNSTMEGVHAGVPMLTFPIMLDQHPNSKLIVDDWKVGLRLKSEQGEESVTVSEKIAEVVKKVMNLVGDESKELRRKIGELKERCHKAFEAGGSASTNLDSFVQDVLLKTPLVQDAYEIAESSAVEWLTITSDISDRNVNFST